jgi:M6 family metalloprotease-like protein
MNPRVGVPFLVALLLASSWAFTNQSVIDEWVRETQFESNNEEAALLPIQTNEHWLVLVADFPEQQASETWGITQAELMLNDIAKSYIEQLTNNQTKLTVVVHDEVTRASSNVAAYGADYSGDRDTNSNGDFLPMNLAEEVVRYRADDVNWSQFDLDNDGIVDRVLILHTTKGQEENPGVSNNIWSHFTRFEEPIKVSSEHSVGHYTMASLRTGSSGMGTVLHEMMHQMGALDLYPVHDVSPSSDWHGVGNWDIMASGNWNGGGVWPALGTSPTMELIGLERYVSLDLTWPTSSVQPCIGPTIQMHGMTEGGEALKIPLGEEQYIWIERHSDVGFDSHLPGHGILVMQQDRSIGDEERNELNRDPEQPWLRVIEADNGDQMLQGVNDGEASDVFRNGTTFGAQGVLIRDHDGILVPWTAHVEGEANMTIRFTAEHCSPEITVNGPDFGAVLLPSDSLKLEIKSTIECSLTHNFTLTDGRTVTLDPANLTIGMNSIDLTFSSNGTANSESRIEGKLACEESVIDLSTQVLTLSRIPIETQIEGTLHARDASTILISIPSDGRGTQSFTIDLDGPMSRVGTIENRFILDGDDELEIAINPNGLLLDGMKVKGDLILIDTNGHRWTYTLDFTAELDETSTFDAWRTPGRILSIICLVGAVWVGMGMVEWKNKESNSEPNHDTVIDQQPEVQPVEFDPWGRPVDGNE